MFHIDLVGVPSQSSDVLLFDILSQLELVIYMYMLVNVNVNMYIDVHGSI